MAYNFFEKYMENAAKTPDKVLLRIDEDTLTYIDFVTKTAVISSALKKLGVEKNDKIGIIMPNSIGWYLVFWSAIRLGAQPVPIDPQSGAFELTSLIPATKIKVCFISEKYKNNSISGAVTALDGTLTADIKFIGFGTSAENNLIMPFNTFLEKYADDYSDIYTPDNSHIMSLACTSGSTGKPKILSVPYHGFYKALEDMGTYLEFSRDDVMMIGMTLYHQGGFGMGLQTTIKGGTVIYQPQFNPETFLETVQKYKVSVIQLTSTLAKVLLSSPNFDKYDFSSVKVCYFAGEVLPKEIADIFVNRLNIRVINIIGSSETATMVIWDSDCDADTDPSDFRKLPFTDFKVDSLNDDEAGELIISTDAVISDYFGNPELSAEKIICDENGKRWFRTGDLVKRLPDGRIRFAGRSKRIIKRGGNLVHAEEVEACLLTHPEISAAAVTDEEHQIIGQQIVAYIQTKDNKKITRGEIARYFDGRLSAYKVPDKIIVVDEIPKDIGKIQFKYLRERKEEK